MGAKTGNYTRNMFDETKRYVQLSMQQGVPVVDADINDGEQITYNLIRRLVSQALGDGARDDGFKVEALSPLSPNDFKVSGGFNENEGPESMFVAGHRAALFAEERYMESEIITPVSTGLTETVLTDSAGLFTPGALVGKQLMPDISQPLLLYTITANTANTITCAGATMLTDGVVAGAFYRIKLTTPGANRSDIVYLDVYLDEIDKDEDANLGHVSLPNPDAARRFRLQTLVFVIENGVVGDIPQPVAPGDPIVDADGNQHWVIPLARIDRLSGNADITTAMITDLRDKLFRLNEVDDRYVNADGDEMTGDLDMNAADINFTGGGKITGTDVVDTGQIKDEAVTQNKLDRESHLLDDGNTVPTTAPIVHDNRYAPRSELATLFGPELFANNDLNVTINNANGYIAPAGWDNDQPSPLDASGVDAGTNVQVLWDDCCGCACFCKGWNIYMPQGSVFCDFIVASQTVETCNGGKFAFQFDVCNKFGSALLRPFIEVTQKNNCFTLCKERHYFTEEGASGATNSATKTLKTGTESLIATESVEFALQVIYSSAEFPFGVPTITPGALPTGATWDSETNILTYTPPIAALGTVQSVTFTGSNGVDPDQILVVNFFVQSVEDSEALTIGEGETKTFRRLFDGGTVADRIDVAFGFEMVKGDYCGLPEDVDLCVGNLSLKKYGLTSCQSVPVPNLQKAAGLCTTSKAPCIKDVFQYVPEVGNVFAKVQPPSLASSIKVYRTPAPFSPTIAPSAPWVVTASGIVKPQLVSSTVVDACLVKNKTVGGPIPQDASDPGWPLRDAAEGSAALPSLRVDFTAGGLTDDERSVCLERRMNFSLENTPGDGEVDLEGLFSLMVRLSGPDAGVQAGTMVIELCNPITGGQPQTVTSHGPNMIPGSSVGSATFYIDSGEPGTFAMTDVLTAKIDGVTKAMTLLDIDASGRAAIIQVTLSPTLVNGSDHVLEVTRATPYLVFTHNFHVRTDPLALPAAGTVQFTFTAPTNIYANSTYQKVQPLQMSLNSDFNPTGDLEIVVSYNWFTSGNPAKLSDYHCGKVVVDSSGVGAPFHKGTSWDNVVEYFGDKGSNTITMRFPAQTISNAILDGAGGLNNLIEMVAENIYFDTTGEAVGDSLTCHPVYNGEDPGTIGIHTIVAAPCPPPEIAACQGGACAVAKLPLSEATTSYRKFELAMKNFAMGPGFGPIVDKVRIYIQVDGQLELNLDDISFTPSGGSPTVLEDFNYPSQAALENHWKAVTQRKIFVDQQFNAISPPVVLDLNRPLKVGFYNEEDAVVDADIMLPLCSEANQADDELASQTGKNILTPTRAIADNIELEATETGILKIKELVANRFPAADTIRITITEPGCAWPNTGLPAVLYQPGNSPAPNAQIAMPTLNVGRTVLEFAITPNSSVLEEIWVQMPSCAYGSTIAVEIVDDGFAESFKFGDVDFNLTNGCVSFKSAPKAGCRTVNLFPVYAKDSGCNIASVEVCEFIFNCYAECCAGPIVDTPITLSEFLTDANLYKFLPDDGFNTLPTYLGRTFFAEYRDPESGAWVELDQDQIIYEGGGRPSPATIPGGLPTNPDNGEPIYAIVWNGPGVYNNGATHRREAMLAVDVTITAGQTTGDVIIAPEKICGFAPGMKVWLRNSLDPNCSGGALRFLTSCDILNAAETDSEIRGLYGEIVLVDQATNTVSIEFEDPPTANTDFTTALDAEIIISPSGAMGYYVELSEGLWSLSHGNPEIVPDEPLCFRWHYKHWEAYGYDCNDANAGVLIDNGDGVTKKFCMCGDAGCFIDEADLLCLFGGPLVPQLLQADWLQVAATSVVTFTNVALDVGDTIIVQFKRNGVVLVSHTFAGGSDYTGGTLAALALSLKNSINASPLAPYLTATNNPTQTILTANRLGTSEEIVVSESDGVTDNTTITNTPATDVVTIDVPCPEMFAPGDPVRITQDNFRRGWQTTVCSVGGSTITVAAPPPTSFPEFGDFDGFETAETAFIFKTVTQAYEAYGVTTKCRPCTAVGEPSEELIPSLGAGNVCIDYGAGALTFGNDVGGSGICDGTGRIRLFYREFIDLATLGDPDTPGIIVLKALNTLGIEPCETSDPVVFQPTEPRYPVTITQDDVVVCEATTIELPSASFTVLCDAGVATITPV